MLTNSRGFKLHFSKSGKYRDWQSVHTGVYNLAKDLGYKLEYPAQCRNFINHISPTTWLYLGVGRDDLNDPLRWSGDKQKDLIEWFTNKVWAWSKKNAHRSIDLIVNMIPPEQFGVYEPSHGGFKNYAELWDSGGYKSPKELKPEEDPAHKYDPNRGTRKDYEPTPATREDPPPERSDGGGGAHKRQDYMRAVLKDIDPEGWFTNPTKAAFAAVKNFDIASLAKTILDVVRKIEEILVRFWNVISPVLGLYWGFLTNPDKTMQSLRKHLPRDSGADVYHPDPSVGLVLGLPFIRDIARSVASQNLMYKYQANTGMGYADVERYILDSTAGVDPAIAFANAAEKIAENVPSWFLND